MMTSVSEDCKIMLSLLRLGINGNKNRCEECRFRPDKAICLGEKQAFLIELLIKDDKGDNLQWDIRDGEIHICEKEILDSPYKCNKRPKNLPVLWKKYLGDAGTGFTEEELRKIERRTLKPYLNEIEDWNKYCEPIVLILAVNACNEIVDRQTLVHLCMNSGYGAVLFRIMMIKTLSLLVENWLDSRKLREIADFYVKFLTNLSNYEYKNELEQNVNEYRLSLCDRIHGTEIDPIHSVVESLCTKRREQGEDILDYFRGMEMRNSAYYVDRLALIQYIFEKKGLSEEKKQLEKLCKIGKRADEIEGCTKKIYDIINAIDACDMDDREAFAKQAGEMIDKCTRDWVDEYIEEVQQQM